MNVLLITSDRQHFRAVGRHTPMLRTPALDRLAAEGMVAERAYCTNPTCSPARATILTGRYPAWHGCWTVGVKLPEDVPTLSGLLGGRGYATNLIGKAHFAPLASAGDQTSVEALPTLHDLDFWRRWTGPYYGFDHVELSRGHTDEAHTGQHYALWLEEQGLADWRRFFRSPAWSERSNTGQRRHSWDLPAELHYSTWTAERTMAAIDSAVSAGQPFFCWASFHDPHPPYLVPEPYASMYDPGEVEPGRFERGELDNMAPWLAETQRDGGDFTAWQDSPHPTNGFHLHRTDEAALRKDIAVYYGMITQMDAQVGRILTRLDRLGVAKDTLVVYTSDHGHFFGQHGLTANGPFHYEDLLRVPLVVRWPDRVRAGSRTDALHSHVDLAPTLLDGLGIPVPGEMQGISQLPVWRGDRDRLRDHVIVENRHQPVAVHLRSYIEDRYKMTIYRGREWGDLFDLTEDPGEHHNRFDDPTYANVKASLMHRFLDAELRREPTRHQRIAFT